MKRRALWNVIVGTLVTTAGLAGCGGHGAKAMESRERGTAAVVEEGMPAEVDELVARWEECLHWAGEEPYDEARRKEIADGVAASCPGNVEARDALLEKYADRADVVARLRGLEE